MNAENPISVRQWLEKFRACPRNPKDFAAQFESDWYDPFFSSGGEIPRRVSRFARLIEAITDPYILDHYFIWFMEHDMPFSGKPYDDIRSDLQSGDRSGQYFLVRLDCAGRKKWALFSERYGFFAPEFECGNVRGMAKYIDGIGRQFAQEIQPVFLLEKRAVEHFITQQDGLCDSIVYRAGEHRYRYKSSKNPKLRTAIAASASEPPPDGFPADQAKEFRGILVWSPDGMEGDMKKEADAQKKPNLKKKEGTER